MACPLPRSLAWRRGRVIRYYSGTKPALKTFTGVAASTPHAFQLLLAFLFGSKAFSINNKSD